MTSLNDDELSRIRNQKVGFVFQSFNLLSPDHGVGKRRAAPALSGDDDGTQAGSARRPSKRSAWADRVHHRPKELSGGQKQRVAIARALVNRPAIIMADEPTGNLDSKVGKEIMDLLLDLNRERGTTLIIITHDPKWPPRPSA